MKFVEFKKSLEEISPCYVFYGNDRFLVENAVSNLMTACGENMPELNRSFFTKSTASEYLSAVNTLPFNDKKKLVIVRDFDCQDNDVKQINEYIKNANPDGVLAVVVSGDKMPKIDGKLVDCNTLDNEVLKKKIVFELNKRKLSIDEVALQNLIDYCSSQLGKIMQEIEKFKSMRLPNQKITAKHIQDNVSKDENYGIYELTEKLAKKDCEGSLQVLSSYIEDDGGKGVVARIYNQFRRMLHCALSSESDDEVAAALNVKPYAVTIARRQGKLFGARALNRICALVGQIDADIKVGNISNENALYLIVFKICGDEL